MECFSLILVCTCSLRPLGLQTGKLTVRQSFSILTARFLSCLVYIILSELDIIYAVLHSLQCIE